MAWKEPRFSLKQLYHPSGLTGGVPGGSDSLICPCGCKPGKEWGTCEQGAKALGIKGTPGLKAEAELLKAARKNQTKKVTRAPTWKGATVSQGKALLPVIEGYCGIETRGCEDSECIAVHKRWGFGRSAGNYHVAEFDVRIYTLPNGATAKVRADKKLKL